MFASARLSCIKLPSDVLRGGFKRWRCTSVCLSVCLSSCWDSFKSAVMKPIGGIGLRKEDVNDRYLRDSLFNMNTLVTGIGLRSNRKHNHDQNRCELMSDGQSENWSQRILKWLKLRIAIYWLVSVTDPCCRTLLSVSVPTIINIFCGLKFQRQYSSKRTTHLASVHWTALTAQWPGLLLYCTEYQRTDGCRPTMYAVHRTLALFWLYYGNYQ